MNISSQIFSFHESNTSGYLFSNGTKVETSFEILSTIYAIGFLFGFPNNFYVIWLIVRGTGNGLAAEIFILNLSICEVVLCGESLLLSLAYIFQFLWIFVNFIDGLLIIGRPLFQCLICVECYLAVVHPVTFLKYKPLRYRLMCSVIVWVAMFVSAGFNILLFFFSDVYFHYLFALVLFLSIQLFCCVAVLRALKQSGPGERGREKEEENHMKKRAINLILITNVTMYMIYTPYTIFLCMPGVDQNEIYISIAQLCFISAGLVQPVFFLYRVGKRLGYGCNPRSLKEGTKDVTS